MYKLEKILAAVLLFSFFATTCALADGQEKERGFRKGRNQGPKGNERSERPGRFQPGKLQHAGNGCPAGTMQAVFAPDGLSFTVLFDQFVADTEEGKRRDNMRCDAILPILIPEGQRMEITRVDYRGFVNVPQKGKASLHSVFNFVERKDRDREKDRINIRFSFAGPLMENYELSTGDMNGGEGLKDTETSPCGGQAFLRIRNEVQVRAPKGEQAQLTVDSVDAAGNAIYYVNWKSCRDDGRDRPGRDDRKDRRDRDERNEH